MRCLSKGLGKWSRRVGNVVLGRANQRRALRERERFVISSLNSLHGSRPPAREELSPDPCVVCGSAAKRMLIAVSVTRLPDLRCMIGVCMYGPV